MIVEDIYKELILEHYRNPSNKGKLYFFNAHVQDSNPLCGDNVEIFMDIKDDIIKKISFDGKGCALSIASASMLTEEIINKNIKDVLNLDQSFVTNMLGLELNHARIKCAMLSLSAIKKAIINFESEKDKLKKNESDDSDWGFD